jgi:type I restriction enzyme S subunit
VVSRALAARGRADQVNDNLEATARTYFLSIFARYADEDFPTGWYWARIGDFCDENVANINASNTSESIAYLDTGSVSQNYFDMLQVLGDGINMPSRAKRKVQHGDIVYSTVRPNLKHYGIVYDPPSNMVVSTGFAVLHNNEKGVSNELLYMWITSDRIAEYLQSMAENSVSTYPTLSVSDLLDVKIVVPDNHALDRANQFLKAIFATVNSNNLEVRQLTSSQDVLLPKLLSSDL